ncbi:MFS transporter [Burkholderia stagnalis]
MSTIDGNDSQVLLNRFDAIPLSRWHVRVRMILGTATFFDAFDVMTIAFVLPVLIDAWQLRIDQIGVLISSVFVGQFFGALLFGWLADRIGRIGGTAFSIVIISGASLACAFAPNYWVLLALRFVQGIGLGGEMPVAATYISEVSQPTWRGRFFLLYELVFPLGLLLAGGVSTWVVPNLGWRAMFLLGAAPAVLIAFVIRTLPESPRWLIARGRLAEAERIIATIERQAGAPGKPAAPAKRASSDRAPELPAHRPATPDAPSFIDQCRSLLAPNYRKRTLLTWVLWISAFTVNLSLVTWLPSIYKRVFHLSVADSLLAGLLPNALQIGAILVCAIWVDRVGRTKWLRWAFAVSAFGLAALGMMTVGARAPVGYIVFVAAFSYAVSGTNCILLYLYTTEIYPTPVRAFGVGASTCCMRIGTALAPLLIGFLIARFEVGMVFYAFAAICAIGAAASISAIETKQARLDEIEGRLPADEEGYRKESF